MQRLPVHFNVLVNPDYYFICLDLLCSMKKTICLVRMKLEMKATVGQNVELISETTENVK